MLKTCFRSRAYEITYYINKEFAALTRFYAYFRMLFWDSKHISTRYNEYYLAIFEVPRIGHSRFFFQIKVKVFFPIIGYIEWEYGEMD